MLDADAATARPSIRREAPERVIAGRAGVGLVSAVPWRVDVPAAEGLVRLVVPDALPGRLVAEHEELRWAVLPQGLPDRVADTDQLGDLEDLWRGTAVGLDLLLDDGTRLSQRGAVDQYGAPTDPGAQAAARRTWVDQWNLRRVRLDPIAGQRVVAVEVVIRATTARDLTIFLDALEIGPVPALAGDPVDRVRTTRGSLSAHSFSRGNTAPLVGVPHGCLYASPITDADERGWIYTWQGTDRPGEPRPALQAIATSHLPSPWIADRGSFQVMPSLTGETDRTARGLAFAHEDETDRPHLWAASLEGGIRVEVTAGPSVMAVRCTFPSDAVGRSIVLDHHGEMRDVEIRHQGEGLLVTGLLVDHVPDRNAPPPAHHVHVVVPRATGHDLVADGGRLRGAVSVAGDVVVLVGLSTLDAATAAAHVEAVTDVDALAAEARERWQAALGTIEIDGASHDQQVALASNLYRLCLYPTRQDEPVGGTTRWRSVYGGESAGLRAPELGERPETGEGWYSATNGFWDTYRTAWPLLALLSPDDAGAAAQGFLAHFADSGWVPRWSAPGPADCMTGTTSDTVLADMVSYGVGGIDLEQAWRSALTHATVAPSDVKVGRTGLHPALFRRFYSTSVHEGMSWTLDGALTDWSASRLGRAHAETLAAGPQRDRVEAECEWLERRSLLYREVFDAERGFFIGRDDDGGWRVGAGFDPDDWGEDYTETNAWGTVVTVPHDGAGLAALHGGEAALGAVLDAVVGRPETGAAVHKGSYGEAIHEMREARDCRMGMVALSNQPAHHIPFMYMHAGRHDDAHALVGDALDRLFVGSDLGQGYPGDEDNGEMSAWWVFGTLGLYPLVPSTATWVLLPPRVARSVIRPAGAERPIEIVVTNPDDGGRYIRSVWIDGEPWEEIAVPQARLAGGALIEMELALEPCGWAAGSRPPSASLIHGFCEVLRDVTEGARASAPGVIDDLAEAAVEITAGSAVEITLEGEREIGDLMTLTLDEPQTLGWRLEAHVDGAWTVIDERAGEVFERRRQTRVFRTRGGLAGVTALRWVADDPCAVRQIEVYAP